MAFLESPIFNIVTDKAITWAIEQIVGSIEAQAFFMYINFNINKEGHDFIQSVLENDKAQKMGSEDEKKIAIKNLENSFSKLIILNK